jgi:hypothetical protein
VAPESQPTRADEASKGPDHWRELAEELKELDKIACELNAADALLDDELRPHHKLTEVETKASDLYARTSDIQSRLEGMGGVIAQCLGETNKVWQIPRAQPNKPVPAKVLSSYVLDEMLPTLIATLLKLAPLKTLGYRIHQVIPVHSYEVEPDYPATLAKALELIKPRAPI